MKRLVLASVVTIFACQVYASKARIQSLQGAEFLKDTQTIFINPAHVNTIGKGLTFEFGGSTTTSSAASPKAEGGIFTEAMDANVGLYLGHANADQARLRGGASFENQNNPLEFFYAKDNWGASLAVSRYEDKNTSVKEQSVTARFGVDNGDSEYYASVDIIADAEKGADKYTGGPLVTAGYETAVDSNYFFGNLKWGATEQEITGTKVDVDVLALSAGVLNRSIENIYYGVSLNHEEIKYTAGKESALTLPFVIGLEKDVTSWAILRASVSQSVLLSETRNELAPANQKIINKNDTVVAAGVGFHHNNFALDGVISASRNGQINGNDVLTSASLTYNF